MVGRVGRPVAVTDAGCSFKALNGFPGPFIKYVNQWFSASDSLQLMQGKSNRRVIIQECLADRSQGTVWTELERYMRKSST